MAAKTRIITTLIVKFESIMSELKLPKAGSIEISPSILAADFSRLAEEIADVEAIHPGYGFLSENAHFAEVCESCNIKFIGPKPETISLVGHKARAIELAEKAGVPTVPGSVGIVATEAEG